MDEPFRPKLPDETVVKEQDDKVLFLVPSKPDWVVTNRNGAIALSLCNGKNSLEDIKSLLSEHPESNDAVLLIETLLKDGFFEVKKGNIVNEINTLLRSVHLNISPSCNLNCNYCYAEERQNKAEKTLTLVEYCQIGRASCRVRV